MNNKELYYELTENGYHIYDKNDPLFHIHQYEPYIPDPSKSYEENAQAQIEELMKEPEEVDITQSEEYMAGYDQAVLDLMEV